MRKQPPDKADKSATRERLVAAAAAMLTSGDGRVSLEAAAERASVTRLTVYHHFGSRAGLLTAVLDEAGRRADAGAMRRAADVDDAVEALRAVVLATCRFWASDALLFRRLVAIAETDRDVGAAVGEREGVRHRVLDRVVARLVEDGRLRPGVARTEVARALFALTSFSTCDHLAGRGRWDVRGLVSMILRLAGALVDVD